MGFGEIRFLKGHDVINSNSWFLVTLKELSGLLLFRLSNIFLLKLNTILTKTDISCFKF